MPRTKKERSDAIDTFQVRLSDLILDKFESGGRDENGHRIYTLEKMANTIGVSKGSLSKWQKGKITGIPNVDYLRRLADYLDSTVEWLAGTRGAERRPNETLAATGLTANAIANLISIESDPFYKSQGMASLIIQSKFFEELVKNIIYLKNHAEYVSALTRIANDKDKDLVLQPIDHPSEIIDPRDRLAEYTEQLKYQRYCVTETALEMLDNITNLSTIIKEAEELLDGYDRSSRFDDYEGKTNS